MFLPKDEFAKVIENAPLVSIDLCILKDGKLLIGKRINPPAKNFFFVPGGRILKSELKKDAFSRILKNELGLILKHNKEKFVKDLGIYEHFYRDNFLDNEEFSTHYVVLAFFIPFYSLDVIGEEIISQQHSEYIWLDIKNINNSKYNIHPNTLEYLKNPIFKDLFN